jgi:WD40 repeat protein
MPTIALRSLTPWLSIGLIGIVARPIIAQPVEQAPVPIRVLETGPLPPGAVRRFGTNLLRLPNARADQLLFSPDDSVLIVSSADSVAFWETTTWREIWRLPAHSFALSPDGRFLATNDREDRIKIWNVREKSLIRECKIANSSIRALNFSAKPDHLWLAVRENGVWLYDFARKEIVERIDLKKFKFFQSSVSPDGNVLAIRGDGDFIAIYDGQTGKLRRQLDPPIRLGQFELNHDGSILGMIDRDGAIAFRRTDTGKAWSPLPPEQMMHIRDAAKFDFNIFLRFAFDGKGQTLFFFEPSTFVADLVAQQIAEIIRPPLQPVSIAVRHDNKAVAVANWPGVVEIREVPRLRPLVHDPHPLESFVGIAFSPDGKTLATQESETLRLWNVADGVQMRSMEIPGAEFSTGALNFDSDGRRLSVADTHVWNADNNSVSVIRQQPKSFFMTRAQATPRFLMLVESDKRGHFVVHDKAANQLYSLPFDVPANSKLHCNRRFTTISADGKTIAARVHFLNDADEENYFGPVVVWREANGRYERQFTMEAPGGIPGLRLSPDGRFLLVLGSRFDEAGKHCLWMPHLKSALWTQIPKDRRRFKLIDDTLDLEYTASAFSPDAQFFALNSGDVVSIHEVLSGQEIFAFKTHDHPTFPGFHENHNVLHLAFSPDGRSLASTSGGSSALLWNIPRFGPAKAGAWRQEHAESMWNNLAGDAKIAYQAMADLHAGGDDAVRLLKSKLTLRPEEEKRIIEQALADLGSADFRTREKASARLGEMAWRVRLYVAELVDRPFDLERKRRLEAIFERAGIGPYELRLNRSIHVLEQIGASARTLLQAASARELLQTLAGGYPNDLATQSAVAALLRLR